MISRTPRQAAEAAVSLLTHAMDARTTTQTAALFELAAERLEQAEMSGFAEEAEELAWNPAAPVQAVRELIQRIEWETHPPIPACVTCQQYGECVCWVDMEMDWVDMEMD